MTLISEPVPVRPRVQMTEPFWRYSTATPTQCGSMATKQLTTNATMAKPKTATAVNSGADSAKHSPTCRAACLAGCTTVQLCHFRRKARVWLKSLTSAWKSSCHLRNSMMSARLNITTTTSCPHAFPTNTSTMTQIIIRLIQNTRHSCFQPKTWGKVATHALLGTALARNKHDVLCLALKVSTLCCTNKCGALPYTDNGKLHQG
mmetsp:Transcript_72061/g.120003  ORF Transcript_72061/g.120003 Transcript_72061/m.120003 type:complete len:204 (+) Transcript_72061:701-1312(+)